MRKLSANRQIVPPEQIPGAVYCETLPDVTAYLRENVREGDIVVTMGAGDIFRAGEALISGEQ